MIETSEVVYGSIKNNVGIAKTATGKRYFLSNDASAIPLREKGEDDEQDQDAKVNARYGTKIMNHTSPMQKIGKPCLHLINWTRNANGSITGIAKISGEMITTSVVVEGTARKRALVKTKTGRSYYLG
mmetsp:Transcript_5394/g.11275  ORF Transcript_5394/g.11275 Transcript_5394/m.11275 type:complete len:128 (-) Transcript_5394:12-395(-)